MNKGGCLPMQVNDDSVYTEPAQTYFYQKDIIVHIGGLEHFFHILGIIIPSD